MRETNIIATIACFILIAVQEYKIQRLEREVDNAGWIAARALSMAYMSIYEIGDALEGKHHEYFPKKVNGLWTMEKLPKTKASE